MKHNASKLSKIGCSSARVVQQQKYKSSLGMRQPGGAMPKRQAEGVIAQAIRLRADGTRRGFETVYDMGVERDTVPQGVCLDCGKLTVLGHFVEVFGKSLFVRDELPKPPDVRAYSDRALYKASLRQHNARIKALKSTLCECGKIKREISDEQRQKRAIKRANLSVKDVPHVILAKPATRNERAEAGRALFVSNPVKARIKELKEQKPEIRPELIKASNRADALLVERLQNLINRQSEIKPDTSKNRRIIRDLEKAINFCLSKLPEHLA